MTLQEIFDLLNNVGVDFDHAFGDQCVDWAQIINRFYKATVLTGANASDIWNTYPQAFYTRIDNAPDNHPQLGDIIIWEGVPGHIAVSTNDADTNQFKSYDQNFPTGSPVHLQEHNYTNPKVLGWLRPKQIPQDLQVQLDQVRLERDNNWNLYQKDETLIANLNQQINDRNNDITQLNAQTNTFKTQVTALQTQVDTLTPIAKQVPVLQAELDQAINDRRIAQNASMAKDQTIASLKQGLPKGFIARLKFLFQ